MAQDHLETHNEVHTAVVAENPPPQEEAPQGSLLTINGTILFIVLSFVLFTIIMNKVFYGPITQIRQKRRDYVKSIKSEATNAQEKAEELRKEHIEKIMSAKKKVSEKTSEVMNEANQEKTKILDEKRQDMIKFLEQGRQKIREERHKTFSELKENISSYAFDISKKILNEEIPIVGVSQEAIDRAINR